MKAKLVVVGGDAKAAEINLKLPTIIGRGREAPLMLPHPLVSRQHCELFEQNGQLVVRDLGSLNGTFINNERITEAVLPNGELLTIGTVTFRAVYDDKGAPRGKAPPPRQSKRGDKTVAQPSDPTVNVDTPPAHPTVAQPVAKVASAPKSAAKLPAAKTAEAASKTGKGKAASPVKAPAPQVSAAAKPPAAPPAKKKAWAESKEDVEPLNFSEDEDDFELGEDESLEPQVPSEFTMQTARPTALGKKDEASDLNVEELDFGAGANSKPPLPQGVSKEKTNIIGGDLTTNFDAKKLIEDEKAKNRAKEEAKNAEQAPKEEPKKASLTTDEDLEEFFKSLG